MWKGSQVFGSIISGDLDLYMAASWKNMLTLCTFLVLCLMSHAIIVENQCYGCTPAPTPIPTTPGLSIPTPEPSKNCRKRRTPSPTPNPTTPGLQVPTDCYYGTPYPTPNPTTPSLEITDAPTFSPTSFPTPEPTTDKTAKTGKSAKTGKTGKSAKTGKTGKSAKTGKTGKTGKSPKSKGKGKGKGKGKR